MRILPIAGVDSHAHIFQRDLPLAAVRRYAPDYDATLDEYLAHLASAGLSHGVLVQPSFLGTDNSFMLDALRFHPERLRGIATVAPEIGAAELDELARDGIVGIRLNLIGLPPPNFSSNPWPALLRNLARRGWPVEVHRQCSDLSVIVSQLLVHGVEVIVDHFGRPDPLLGERDPGFRALLALSESGRVWIKLSAPYRSDPANVSTPQMVTLLRASFGPQRLLWGSDWPHTQFERSLAYPTARRLLDDWIPDAAERQLVLVDNPARLFRLG